MDVKFNPSKMPLIEEMLKKMPTLDQVVSLTEDESTLKLCKTCKQLFAIVLVYRKVD